MAITKKAIKIQQEKAVIRSEIEQVNSLLRTESGRVPKVVLAGPHQMAVDWKDLAEKAHRISGTGSENFSVQSLRRLLAKRNQMLSELRGEAKKPTNKHAVR